MTRKATKIEKKVETLVLLDTHAILHRAYHALPDFMSPTGEPTGALFGVVTMLLKIIEELKPDYIAACYDLPEPTHRHVAFDAYKAGRAKTDDALVAQIIRSRDIFDAFGIPMYEYPGFEADDILGTIVALTKDDPSLRIIIASGDMDTLQLVSGERVLVYTLKKGIQDTILYNEEAVIARFGFGPDLIPDYKGLRGDPSDNIPGIKGIGEKTATELITRFGGIEDIYRRLKKKESDFIDAGIKERMVRLLQEGEEEALFSKMLATIRRDAPIPFVRPATHFAKAHDEEKVLDLFTTFGFRTLTTRVRNIFGLSDSPKASGGGVAVDPARLRRAGVALWLIQSDTTNPTQLDIEEYGRARGVHTFEEIESLLMKTLEEEKLLSLYEDIEAPLTAVLERMEARGILLDTEYLGELGKTFHEELTHLETALYKEAGVTFNLNSPKQLGEVLYDTLGLKPKGQKRTATGQRSTRESELEKLRDDHPIIPLMLRYRELQKLVSTYVDPLPTLVGTDGRLHTTFLQAGSTTGRMATQNPSIQNIPVRTDEGRAIRKGFIAEKGYTLISFDYSQIELRIAAFLSGDEKLLEIFRNGEDVHRGVAAQVFAVPQNEVTSEMRRRAKIINFGILYGMGVNALRTNLGEDTTRTEAQEFLNAYFNTFTRLAEYLEETKMYARAEGYTRTYFGRKRHFSGIHASLEYLRAQAERMAINAPIQGTSADLIRVAMVRIQNKINEAHGEDTVRMLLQVHDELVFEIHNDVLDQWVPLITDCMETVLPLTETLGVPLRVEAKAGKNWQDMEPLHRVS